MMTGGGLGHGIGQVYGGIVGNAVVIAFNSQVNDSSFVMSSNISQVGIIQPHQVGT